MKKTYKRIIALVLAVMIAAPLSYMPAEAARKGSKKRPYVVRLSRKDCKKNFYSTLQEALDKSRDDKWHYYRIVIPKGTYSVLGTIKIYDRTTLVAKGAKIYAERGQNLLTVGSAKEKQVTGYNGHKDITILGGVWDGNRKKLTRQGKFTDHVMVRIAHCTNMYIYGATFTNENGNHTMEMAASKNIHLYKCKFTNAREARGNRLCEAVQIDVCDRNFKGFYNGNGVHYGCYNVKIHGCTFRGVGEGVGSHSYSKKHPHQKIQVYKNTFSKFTRAKRTGDNGYSAIRALGWRKSAIYQNRISGPYIGVSMMNKNSGTEIYKNSITSPRHTGIMSIESSGGVKIHRNSISSSQKYGIAFINGDANAVILNKIKKPKKYGIFTFGKKTNIDKIVGNKISQSSKCGIEMEQQSKVGVVSLNRVRSVAKSGICTCWFAKVKTMSSNTVTNAGYAGIFMTSFSRVGKVRNNAVGACGNANKARIKKTTSCVAINATSIRMPVYARLKIPVSKGSGNVKFKSSNKGICEVSKKGKLKAKGRGRATITASIGSCTSTVPVTVY